MLPPVEDPPENIFDIFLERERGGLVGCVEIYRERERERKRVICVC